MATKDSKKIKVEISGDVTGLRKSINTATSQVNRFGQDLKKSLTTFGGQGFDGLKTGFLGIGAAATAAATVGVYSFIQAMGSSIAKAREFSTAIFGMQSSLDAANRQFKVGTAKQWEKQIQDLGKTLKVYSETDLRNAAARTVDMTKRLGMSSAQMKKVIEISGELGAGKTSIVDAVERVTSALRGEAEASEYLGLTLNEDYVKAWYNAKGATQGAWKDLTDLQKAQSRFNILIEQASPSLGKAAESVKIYDGALAVLKNDFGKMQEEAGGLVTNNTFVIESFKVLSETLKSLTGSIVGNRDQLVNLVRVGFLSLVGAIGGAIETIRFFYNAWQGLGLIAAGATTLMIKGLGMTVTAIRGVLLPFDLLLSGMAKIRAIDSNPLKDWEKTLGSLGNFSAAQLQPMIDKITATNQTFDQAKQIVEQYRQKIAEIPAEYKSTAEQMKGSTEAVAKEAKLIGGVWTNVYDEADKKSETAKTEQVKDTKTVGKEAKLIGDVWTNTYDEAGKQSDEYTSKALANIEKIKRSAAQVRLDKIFSGSGASASADGFARGGNPFFGGLRGYGGGDRRLILVEDGEHVIRKEATAALGHGFFQKYNSPNFLRSLPRFATGGPIGPAPAVSMAAGATYNQSVTVNVSGTGGQSSAREIAKTVLTELQKMHRGRS